MYQISGKRMKLFTCLVLLSLAIRGEAQKVSSVPANPITISLMAESESFKVGSQIKVKLIMKNTSNNAINLQLPRVRHSEYYGFRFVLKLSGQDITRSSFHRALMREHGVSDPEVLPIFSYDTETLDAGQSIQIVFDVNKLFEISKPGDYFFSVDVKRNMDIKSEIQPSPIVLQIKP